MNSDNHIAFICGDKRQIHLANLFISNNWHVYTYGISSNLLSKACIKCISLESILNHSNIIVFPFKIASIDINDYEYLAKLLKEKIVFGGNITKDLSYLFSKYKVKFYDFFKVDYVTRLNAIATAEGCIMEAIKLSPYNLHASKCLVLGFGNCGQVLATKLKNLDCNVTISCRNPYFGACARTYGINYVPLNHVYNCIQDFLFIFNTIPAKILTKRYLDLIKKEALIIDIASEPGGIDLEYAGIINLNAVNIPGIPGKVAAISSAQILYDYINEVLC